MASNGSRGLPRGCARGRGFTLIELMIVVVIIAILASIAIPSYGRYAFRARRGDAQELLLRIANAQERFYATNNQYGKLTDLGYASPAPSEKGYYNVSVALTAAGKVANQGYTATAAPAGVQASDVCGNLSIDNAGVKAPASNASSYNTNGSCW